MEFPLSLSQIKKFEKQNPKISVHVLGWDREKDIFVGPLYKSQNQVPYDQTEAYAEQIFVPMLLLENYELTAELELERELQRIRENEQAQQQHEHDEQQHECDEQQHERDEQQHEHDERPQQLFLDADLDEYCRNMGATRRVVPKTDYSMFHYIWIKHVSRFVYYNFLTHTH